MSVGKIKQIAFSEGTSVSAPISVGSTSVGYDVYATEADFVTANGAASVGDAFYDSTLNCVKVFINAAWRILANTTEAQTFTTKMLTSPVINTPTGIVKGDVGLGNVDNTSDATKDAAAVTLVNKTMTAPILNAPTVGTSLSMLAGAEMRYYDADASNYVGFKAPALSGNKIWSLPTGDGTSGQVLSTDGSGNLSWATAATDATAQYAVKVGDSGGTAVQVVTTLLGDIKASHTVQTFVDADVDTTNDYLGFTGHTFKDGQKFYLTNSGGTLPGGLSANTTYYVIVANVNAIKVATSLANAYASSGINITSAAGGGTHTIHYGGLEIVPGGIGAMDRTRYTTATGNARIRTWSTLVYAQGITHSSGSFTIATSGIYSVSYTECLDAADYFAIGLNASSAVSSTNLATTARLAMGYTVAKLET